MTSEDPLAWFTPSEPPSQAQEAKMALEAAGDAARLGLFNVVRAAFDRQFRQGKTTRAKVAAALGVSPQAVGRLLRKPSNMTIETAGRLMFVLDEELRLTARSQEGVRASALYFEHMPSFGIETARAQGAATLQRLQASPLHAPETKFETINGVRIAWISGAGADDGPYEKMNASTGALKDADITRFFANAKTPGSYRPLLETHAQ